MAKNPSPVSRQQFREGARPVAVQVNGGTLIANIKEFATGSLGWYLSGKATVEIGGIAVPVQVGMNLTVIGSKELPK